MYIKYTNYKGIKYTFILAYNTGGFMIQIHDFVFILSLVLMTCVLGAFVFVVVYSADKTDYQRVQPKAYRLRRFLFGIVLIGGIVATASTISPLPYASTQKGQVDEVQIAVEGKQWYWVLSQNHAPVNTQVTFNVSSGDVNHGFGIYDSNLRLLAQTQAMPGYTNKLVHTFKETGNYQMMCLEYCGLVHHAMISNFSVTEVETGSEL
ncbi:MAG: hypothetical protein R3E74_01810 [Pseudomonadales bacterium]|nr:hypothetical protein [Pseudomonadales bacterium]